MKNKILLFLILCSSISFAQVSTGQEQEFDYGIKNNSAQTVSDPVFVTTQGADGTYGKITAKNLLAIKSSLSTGLIKNGAITISGDPTKFNVTAGIGIISNFDDPENPISTIVNFPAFNGVTPTYLTTGNITYIAINSTPAIVMQATPFTAIQRRDLIELGAVIHSNLTTINVINNLSSPANASTNQLHDLFDIIGALNLSGNVYSANGANLQLNKSAGIIGKRGVNFINDWKDPHRLSQAGQTALSFRYRTQNGTEFGDRINLDPALYDLNNVLTAVPNNKFTIQTVVMFQTGLTRILYGQQVYDDLQTAINAVLTRSFVIEPNSKDNGIIRSYIIMRNTTTSLQNVADATILEAQKFGGVASGGVALTLANIVTALGYTPENVANKSDSFTVSSSTTYSSTKALVDGLVSKLDNRFVINDYVSQNPPTEFSSSLYESFPLMIRGNSNKIFAYYRQGATHSSSKGIIQVRTSSDGGGTWSNASTVVSDATYDCRNVSGGVTPTGRIVLFYMRYVYGSSVSFDQGYIYSDNEGSTWSSYNAIPSGTHNFYSPYGKIISIGNGKIMANWYGETSSTPTYSSYIITSSDNGTTWSSATEVATSGSIRFGEASYAYLDGGVIIGIIRNSVGAVMQQVKSTNNGVTWTIQEAITFDAGAQVSPELATYIDANNEKYVVCFYANRSDNKLKSISGSYSGLIAGVSGWSVNSISTITTHTGTDFGYPSVVKSREGNKFLLAIYKATSTTLASINFLNFTPLYNDISAVSTIKTSSLFRNNRGIGTYFLIDNSAGINRWAWQNINTESGGNVGSDFNLLRFDDSGNSLGSALAISRNTGRVAVNDMNINNLSSTYKKQMTIEPSGSVTSSTIYRFSLNANGANIFSSISNSIQVGELYAYEIGTSNWCRYSLMKANTASSTTYVLAANNGLAISAVNGTGTIALTGFSSTNNVRMRTSTEVIE